MIQFQENGEGWKDGWISRQTFFIGPLQLSMRRQK